MVKPISHPFIQPNKSVLLDANLLAVWLVGQLGMGEVEKNKRTRNFTSGDAVILDSVLQQFLAIKTTPHILTETSNLLDWVTGQKQADIARIVSKVYPTNR